MTDLDVGALKVAELKTELTSRGLSTKGLKAELATRLQEAVDAATSDQPAPSTEDAPAQADEKPDQEQTAKAPSEKPEASEQAQENGDDSKKAAEQPPPATNGHAAPAQEPEPKAEQGKKEGSPAAAESQAIADNQAEASEALHKHDSERVDAVMAKEPETVAPEHEKESAEPPKSPRESDAIDEAEERKRKRHDPAEESTGPTTTAPADQAKPHSAPQEEEKNEPENKKRRVSADAERSKQPAAEDPKPAAEGSSSTSSEPPPSEGLFIGNLIRPLNHIELKDLLGDYGQVEDFFIDKIKSRAYALFSEVSAAQKAREAMNGQVWPPTTGKPLAITFVSKPSLSKLLDEERQNPQPRKLDLATSFEDGEWHYHLKPVGAAQPNGPQPDLMGRSIRGLASAVPMQSRDLSRPPPPNPVTASRDFDRGPRPPAPTGPRRGVAEGDSRRNTADAYASRSRRAPSSPPPPRARDPVPPPDGMVTRSRPPIVWKPYKPL